MASECHWYQDPEHPLLELLGVRPEGHLVPSLAPIPAAKEYELAEP